MAVPPDSVQYRFLREMLQFGLNMTRMARLTHDSETATRAANYAYEAMKDYHRFRAGIALPLPEHQELEQLAIELSKAILDSLR